MRLIEMDLASPKRIVVVGDALVDVYIHGHREDCQDGCQKFVKESRVVTPGGAANAANCLRHWHSVTHLYSQLPSRRGVKTRYVENGAIVFRADDESVVTSANEYKWLREQALAAVKQADAVLLCDYDKGFLTREFIEVVVATRIPCVADAKREPNFYRGCILKCNCHYAIRNARDILEHPTVVVTNGVIVPAISGLNKSGPLAKSYADVICINHVGAGDCFAAHLTLALAHGLPLEEAANIAHSAGRVYVQHLHNRPPQPKEVQLDFLQE